MKIKLWFYQLLSALLAWVLAVGSVGTLISAYGLPVGALWPLCLWCALAAIVSAVLFRLRYGGRILAGLAGLVVVRLGVVELFYPHLLRQVQTLCYLITSHYHDVYDWPVLGAASAETVAVPLTLWAALVAVCAAWHICRRKPVLLAIVPAVLPLVLCFVTADKMPDAVPLFMLILGLATLMITNWTRRKQPAQGMKLMLWTVLPIALALAILLACNPKQGYVNQAGRMQKEAEVWLEEFLDKAEGLFNGTPIDSSGGKSLNLRTVGARGKSTRSVMFVTSPVDGVLYLRERDYDVYSGMGWEATTRRKEQFTSGSELSSGSLTIVTYGVRGVLYVPYYSSGKISLIGGAVDNDKNLQEYSYKVSNTLSEKTDFPSVRYKNLPEETQVWAKRLVAQITVGAKTDREKMQAIQKYVRNYGTYDTNTAKMDTSNTDFARWFLEESETGYCIHYATATAVLLRAAGIPARYVEGYIVDCEAGVGTAVSKQQSHAWVEYYDWISRAWCIVEATPAYPEAERPNDAPGGPLGDGLKPDEWLDEPAQDTPVQTPSVEETPDEELPTEEVPIEDLPLPPTTETEETEEPVTPEDPDTPGVDRPTQEPATQPERNYGWVKPLLIALAAVGAVLLQAFARIFCKRRRWNGGEPNRRAIYRWRKTRFLARRLKQAYPEALDALAQKAVFSQHELLPEELQLYDDYRRSLIALLAEKPLPLKLCYLLVLAVDISHPNKYAE